MLPETLRTIYGDPDADATEFGTKYFVWGTPPEPFIHDRKALGSY